MKRILHRLFSMRMAIGILILLIMVCLAGSLIQQGQTQAWYESTYSEGVARVILMTGADDIFHVWWFVALTALLCLNLLGCNLLRFPTIIRRMNSYEPEKRISSGKWEHTLHGDAEVLFRQLGFRRIVRGSLNGQAYLYSVRNKAGLWGAWLTHLGLLIIIVAFALGQSFTVKYTVYGVPGQTKQIPDTPYELRIDDFSIELREDETVEQYTSTVTLTDTEASRSESGETSVNHPAQLLGYQVYQNSTGWAATVRVTKSDEPLQEEILCAGEFLPIADKPELVVYLKAFYPDYVNVDGRPATASSQLKNPGYLYTVYYKGNVIGMNVLVDDYISIDEYSIYLESPQPYTLLQLKRDPFTFAALIGGIVILAAIFLAFYCRTEELWAQRCEDGTWQIAGDSRKGGVLFHEALARAVNESENPGKDETV